MKNLNQYRQNFRQSMGEEFELMHTFNEESFESSPEGSYWKKRSRQERRKTQSYQKFNSFNDVKRSRRKKTRVGGQFKKSAKWYGYDGKYFDYQANEYVNNDNVRNFGIKNRVFCPCCRKTKFIFSTKEKAENYMRYNGEEIERNNGYRPIRSYRCPVCDGWHTTHQQQMSEEEILQGSLIYEDYKQEVIASEIDSNPNTEISTEPQKDRDSLFYAQERKQALIYEIELAIEDDMAKFNKLLASGNIKQCKNVNARLRRLFDSYQGRVQKTILKSFYDRLDNMSRQIKDREKKIAQEKENIRKVVWGLQRVFKSKMQLFTKKFALGKYDECEDIYYELCRNISTFPKNLSVIQDFRRELQMMEARLYNCGQVRRASA